MDSYIKGIVIEGNKIGREIGFPTANLSLNGYSIDDGVYLVNVFIDGEKYRGAGVSLGFKGVFEVNIFGLSGYIYGKEIECYLIKKIRNNQKFDTLEELKTQIQKDVEYMKTFENIKVMTFGTFDIVHLGHEYYLSESKKYGDRLITMIGRDINVCKIKGKKPRNNEEKRWQQVKDMGISDVVELGDESDPYKFIAYFKPHVICFGYDQDSFTSGVQNYLDKIGLDAEIKNINSYNPHIYKSSLL